MPVTNNVFTRIWTFVSRFSANDSIDRTDHDVAFNDVAAALNLALSNAQAGIAAAAAAQAAADAINTTTDMLSFGAVGDGVTDDQGPVDSASTSASPVDLLGRTYRYFGTFTPTSGLRFFNGSVRDNLTTHNFNTVTYDSYRSISLRGSADITADGLNSTRNSLRKISERLTEKAEANDPIFSGLVTVSRIRVRNATDVSSSSANHGFQIGPDSGLNLRADSNEMQVLNNGTPSTMGLQSEGGNINLGAASSTINVPGTINASGDISASGLLQANNIEIGGDATINGSPVVARSSVQRNGDVAIVFANYGGVPTLNYGDTVPGSVLFPAGLTPTAQNRGSALTGTWECIGRAESGENSLFVKIL